TICLICSLPTRTSYTSSHSRAIRQQSEHMKIGQMMNNQGDISVVVAGIRSRLDTLASINAANMLIPGGPQERYHQIVEEAYAALGLIETQIDELRTELEYQYRRLDEIRNAVLEQEMEQ